MSTRRQPPAVARAINPPVNTRAVKNVRPDAIQNTGRQPLNRGHAPITAPNAQWTNPGSRIQR